MACGLGFLAVFNRFGIEGCGVMVVTIGGVDVEFFEFWEGCEWIGGVGGEGGAEKFVV